MPSVDYFLLARSNEFHVVVTNLCGIIGYIGQQQALPLLQKGLKNLEYRGYDSIGMATISDSLNICKATGTIDKAMRDLDQNMLDGRIGIGHTRWATHGGVSRENAHPHVDCQKKIAIVHNGIIENHRELREELRDRGHNFASSTDSEVIAHLIEDNLREDANFESACIAAFSRLRGSYAVLAICEGDQKIVASRKDSPLVLGLTEDGLIFASDVSALLEWTKRVVYLQNHDLAIATNEGVVFRNLMLNKEVSREVSNIQWDMEQAKKGEFEHFMLKEIAEQAQTISRAIQQDEAVIKNIMELVNKTTAVFLVGCGSSYHACLVGSYLFSKVAKLNVNLVVASEFERYEHFLNEDSLVIAVSQSGETADVLEVVRAARERNSKIIAITNVIGSSLAREGEELLLMNSGPEICVLSTKTYTSQVVLMFLLAYSLAGKKDECSRRIKGLYMDVYNLTSKSMREELKALAGVLADREHIYMIGRGLQFATAKEAALKVKEVSYIHTEAFAGGELKHGPLALIEEGTPVFVFIGEENQEKTLSNAQEIKARGGMVIGVSAIDQEIFDYWIKVPSVWRSQSRSSGHSIADLGL